MKRIVTAHAPKRTNRKATAAAVLTHVVVEARDPRRIRRSPSTATSIAGHANGAELSEDELRQRGDAADRLWQ